MSLPAGSRPQRRAAQRRGNEVIDERLAATPTHPGECFREEYRLRQDPPVSQAAAARQLGISGKRLHEIERGKRGITAAEAVAMEAVTGTSAETWMQRQLSYDLWRVRGHAIAARRLADSAV